MVSGYDAIRITATFSEAMSPTPLISISGIVTDTAMTSHLKVFGTMIGMFLQELILTLFQ